MTDVLKQVKAIVDGRAQALLNQFEKLGKISQAEIQLITANQNGYYLMQIFKDDKILKSIRTSGIPTSGIPEINNSNYTYNSDWTFKLLTDIVDVKLKTLDPSLRTECGMDFSTWYNSLPQNHLYTQKFQNGKSKSFQDDLVNYMDKANRTIAESGFVHYFPIYQTTSKEMTWRVYLCPEPQNIGQVIGAINNYLMSYLEPRDHGIRSFKHVVDTVMDFKAKDRMVLYMAGKEKAIEIGEAIHASCSAFLISDTAAVTINTTEVKPGVYIAPEPGRVSTGMDRREENYILMNSNKQKHIVQQQQTVTILSSNMISMALVNWYHDFVNRMSTQVRHRDRQFNTINNLLNDPNSRDLEYQLFLKYVAVAMNAYKNQFAGYDMINGR